MLLLALFVLTPDPVAIIKVFEPSESTYLQRASHPSRRILEKYRDVDILSMFVREIKSPEAHNHLQEIPMTCIKGKALLVQLENSVFIKYMYLGNLISTFAHN